MADQNGYKESIITFIDILGFRDIVQNKKKHDEILRILKATNKFFRYGTEVPEDPDSYGARFINFSDSIVRTLPINSETNILCRIGILFLELIHLLHAQCELLQYGIFVRGAMTIDLIYHDESLIFGPGLISAYDVEQCAALYPRIVIDPKVLASHETNELLRSDNNSFEDEQEILQKLLRCASDGVWFIDYLKAMISEVDEMENYWLLVEKHRELILDFYNQPRIIGNVAIKYNWLVQYHNDVLKEINQEIEMPSDWEKLLIDPAKVETMHAF